MRDSLLNKFYYLRGIFFKKYLKKRIGNYSINLDKYELVVYDEFINNNGNRWSIHKYYDKFQHIHSDQVDFSNTGLLIHQTGNKVGQVTSNKFYRYGLYEFNIELPQGKNLNPKINMIGSHYNPPKINLINAVSNKYGNYIVRNNIYYGYKGLNEAETGFMLGLRYDDIEIKTYPINIKVEFQPKFINIYMDDFKVRTITDKTVLKYFKNQKFKFVMTNAICENSTNKKSVFRILNFSYYMLKK